MSDSEATKRLQQVYRAIERLSKKFRMAPTVRELAQELQRPVTSIHNDLYSLREQGKVEWQSRRARTLRVRKPSPSKEKAASAASQSSSPPRSPR